jgi:hypothetical protein
MKTEIVLHKDIEYAVIYTYSDSIDDRYHVDFKAVAITGIQEDGTVLYQDADYELTEDPSRAATVVSGDVKWDGCSNTEQMSGQNTYLHTCSREGLANLGALYLRVFDEAHHIMGEKSLVLRDAAINAKIDELLSQHLPAGVYAVNEVKIKVEGIE